MAKQWTRNYDNLFCAAFGCDNIPNSGQSDPSFTKPMVRRVNGLYYPIIHGATNYNKLLNAYNLIVPKPYGYMTDWWNTKSLGSADWLVQTTYIAVGAGTKEPTYDDYHLQSALSGFSVGSVSAIQSYDDDTHIYTRTYKVPLNYSGSSDVTVSEFGIYVHVMTDADTKGYPVLIYRETLDNPVTLSQNDTLEVTFSQSIMQPNYTPYPTT